MVINSFIMEKQENQAGLVWLSDEQETTNNLAGSL
jgi:hypothetical protein